MGARAVPGWLWKAWLAGGLAAASVFAFLPPGAARVWAVVFPAIASCVMLAGVWLRRPKRPWPFWLFGAGLCAFTVMYWLGTPPPHGTLSPGRYGIVNLFFLAGYLLVVSGGVMILRYRVGHRDKDGFLDGAIVGCAIAVALWELVSQPALVERPGHNVFGIATYPLFAAFCSAIALRLLLANGWRCVPLWMAFLAATNDTICNAMVSAQDHVVLAPPLGWQGAMWLANFPPLVAAVLHPRLDDVNEPVDFSDLVHSSSRLFVLGAALLVAPAVVLVGARDLLAGGLASTAALALVLLVTWRLGRLVRQWERARADADRRATLQAAVVGLGRMALHSGDMASLFAEGSAVISRSLGRGVTIARAGHIPSYDEADPARRASVARHLGPVSANGDRRNGRSANGQAANGQAANGQAANGQAANGQAANGDSTPAGAADGSELSLRFGLGDEYAIVLDTDGEPTADEQTFLEAVTMVLGGAVKRHRAEEDIRYRALHDDLTGLPNRALLLEHLVAASARARRTGMPVAVLFVDLDGFKSVNDTYGHAAGDDLLVNVADSIATAVRNHDTVARIAGDEFVAVCEEITPADAELVAERIQAAIAEPALCSGHELNVTASVGIAIAGAGFDPDAVLRTADENMYRAKRAARRVG